MENMVTVVPVVHHLLQSMHVSMREREPTTLERLVGSRRCIEVHVRDRSFCEPVELLYSIVGLRNQSPRVIFDRGRAKTHGSELWAQY
jgi:hypothetical protein